MGGRLNRLISRRQDPIDISTAALRIAEGSTKVESVDCVHGTATDQYQAKVPHGDNPPGIDGDHILHGNFQTFHSASSRKWDPTKTRGRFTEVNIRDCVIRSVIILKAIFGVTKALSNKV